MSVVVLCAVAFVLLFFRVRFAVDFSVLVMTLVCGFTVFADQTSVLITAYLMSFVTFLLQHFFVSFHSVSSKSWTELMTLQLPTRLSFITHFRAYVNLATAICILAVDFIVFPRRFCKAETYGTGIMDVGVGAYVVANAIVSPEAKGRSSSARFSIQFSLSKITFILNQVTCLMHCSVNVKGIVKVRLVAFAILS